MDPAAGGPPEPGGLLIEELAAATQPVIIGVRHHSAALAAAMPALLEAAAPPAIYLEMPSDLQSWLPWLAHADLRAPVVVSAATASDVRMYPFADFSPELQAIRWAAAHDVPVVAMDAPAAADLPRGSSRDDRFDAVLAAAGVPDLSSFWEQEIEARAATSTPEALRRAALAVGAALRRSGPSPSDLVRETCMRRALAEAPPGSVAVIGAFHGPGLLEGPDVELELRDETVATSLVPYAWDLLDERSGYPAGIKDPALQQAMYEAYVGGTAPTEVVARISVDVGRHLRRQGHASPMPDETLRMATDLARIRGQVHPGRRELLESLMSTMGQGQPLGRGQALARALQEVCVGQRIGVLPCDAPRSGLVVEVEQTLATLRLPGAGDAARTLRLDPLRSDLDRRRQLVLLRLHAAGVPYGELRQTAGETLGATWEVHHRPSTTATLSLASRFGVTLETAAGGMLRHRRRRGEREQTWTAASLLHHLAIAAEAGLLAAAGESLDALHSASFLAEAGTPELVGALRLLARIRAGHCIGTPSTDVDDQDLLRAAIRQVDATAGSTDLADVLALAELHTLLEDSLHAPTLARALDRIAVDGGPLMQGAARGLRALGQDPADLGLWLASSLHGATHDEARRTLTDRFRGALSVASIALSADPELLSPVCAWVDTAIDAEFLPRLPALRGGFEVLSPAARQRFLEDRLEGVDLELDTDPLRLAAQAAADHRAAEELTARFGPLPDAPDIPTAAAPALLPRSAQRWRLILGRERRRLDPRNTRTATALDELYGQGQGEGSRGGGSSPAFPETRAWAEELDALFGGRIRDEVLAVALAEGRTAALQVLDPDTVQPSIELLQQVLSLAGSLGEARLAQARRLVQRVVDDLTRALARQVRPALTGPAMPRRTSRPTPHLDLPATIRRNLGTIRLTDRGPMLVPERLVFRHGRAHSVAWELTLVVDVSGSMEASIIHAAMMAAILSAAPFLRVRFLAFNTEVIDLSDHIDDPLALLLEVRVGGGTHIGRAVQHAADHIRVPSRAMVIVVSDFEEGGNPGLLHRQVQRLVQSGATCLGIAALGTDGAARYHAGIAGTLAGLGMPIAAVSPLELARWVGDVVHG